TRSPKTNSILWRKSIAMLRSKRTAATFTLLIFLFVMRSQNAFLSFGPLMLSAQSEKEKGEKGEKVRELRLADATPAFHPDRILVRFKGEGRPRVIQAQAPLEAIERYRADGSVLYAEPDYLVQTDTTTPSDPLWQQQWDMVKISAPEAWD